MMTFLQLFCAAIGGLGLLGELLHFLCVPASKKTQSQVKKSLEEELEQQTAMDDRHEKLMQEVKQLLNNGSSI